MAEVAMPLQSPPANALNCAIAGHGNCPTLARLNGVFMNSHLNQASIKRLQEAVVRFKDEVPEPIAQRWEHLTDADLWAAVLGQIAVVGAANSGDLLKNALAEDLDSWFQSLTTATPAARLKSIHVRMRTAGVRYVTKSSEHCKKSRSAAYDFEIMAGHGGPNAYFKKLSEVPDEEWRVGILSEEFQYVRSKGARDLLIGLGLVKNAIALDSRLQTVLKNVGARVPTDLATNRVRYKALERELLEGVCRPCSISGAHLDRILFAKWKEVA